MRAISILGADRSPAAKAPAPVRAPLWRFLPLFKRLQPLDTATTQRMYCVAIEGACLAPYLEPGDLAWVDPLRAPKPGDLVAALMRYEPAGVSTMLGSRRPPPIERASLKQLQRGEDGELRLCAAEGCCFAREHRIEGVVVVVQRRPSWRRWRSLRAPLRRMEFLPIQSQATS